MNRQTVPTLAIALALSGATPAPAGPPQAPPTPAQIPAGAEAKPARDQPPARILNHQPPPDAAWTADAEVAEAKAFTDAALGAAQGVAVHDGKVYVYGDNYRLSPRVGVIREYDQNLSPTGRELRLSVGGKPLIVHPTGLTWHDRLGTFLGDTVFKKAVIYRLDWDRAWADGTLDRAVLDVIDDDAAVNGCRPLFVEAKGRTLLATADYGDVRPELRLYDPDALLAAKRSSAPGVVVARVLCGPFNQNLAWDAETRELTCVQNVIEGRGWRLDVIDLDRALLDGRAAGPGVRRRSFTFTPHDELEGYCPLDRTRSLLVTSSRDNNLLLGVVRPAQPHASPPGTR